MSDTIAKIKDFLIYHSEWYDFNFAEFAMSDDKDFISIRKYLLDDKYTVAQTGQTYRVINSWDSSGLLFENKERENGWRKFSLTEYVWIAILRELRTIGLSITCLKTLRDKAHLRLLES